MLEFIPKLNRTRKINTNNFSFLFCITALLLFYNSSGQIPEKGNGELFQVKPVILPSIKEKTWEVPKSTFERETQVAIKAAQSGNYRKSINFFRRLGRNVDNPYLADFYLGLIFFENELFPLAIQHMKKSISNKPILMDCRFYMGLAYLNMGQIEEAVEHFETLQKLEEYRYLGLYGNAMMSIFKNQKEAEKLFRQSLKSNPEFLPSIDKLIQINLSKNNAKKALDLIQKGLDLNPDWTLGNMYMLTMEMQNDMTSSKNLNILNQVLSNDPDNIQYLFLKSLHYYLEEDYRKAVENFVPTFISMSRYVQREINTEEDNQIENMKLTLLYYQDHLPTDLSTLKLLDEVVCSFVMGDKRAIELMKKLESKQSDIGSMMEMLFGMSYINLKEHAEAIDILGKAILSDSSNWAAHLIRGKLFEKYLYSDYAIQDFSQARFLQPKLKEVYSVKGKVHYSNKEYESAYQSFSRAVAIDNQDIFISKLRGLTAMKLGEYKEATIDFNRITKIDPFNSEVHLKLYECYSYIGDTSLTMLHLDTASMYSKNDDYAHYELIRMGKALNFSKQIEVGYQRLVDYNPLDIVSLIQRGKYFHDCEKFENAVQDFEKGISLSKSTGIREHLEELIELRKKSKMASGK